jgi:hypothetical protein
VEENQRDKKGVQPRTYYDAARTFAKVACSALEEETEGALSVVIQNAYKAIEFALTGLALSRGRKLLDHGQTIQFARNLKIATVDRVVEALTLYSRSYTINISQLDAKRIVAHMKHVLEELGRLADYDFSV